jgi:ribosomal protein S18 acetylase RimI-like enzyme
MLLERLQRPVRGVRIVRKQSSPYDPDVSSVQIIPYRRLNAADVSRVLASIEDSNALIVTSALAPREQEPFLEAGFVEHETLHLLEHDLASLPEQRANSMGHRPGRRSDLRAVLDIDHRSFDPFWALDRQSLNSARKATPVHRYRVSTANRKVHAYSIAGRAGRSSFLQRLAVAPEARGQGIGSYLVVDALRWATGEGAQRMLVNTQVSNDKALGLYEMLGFVLSNEQLKVLEWPR